MERPRRSVHAGPARGGGVDRRELHPADDVSEHGSVSSYRPTSRGFRRTPPRASRAAHLEWPRLRPTQTMALTVGTRLVHYDVTAMIGSARVHHRQFVFLASTFALISPLFRKSSLKCFANASAADWKLFFFTL